MSGGFAAHRAPHLPDLASLVLTTRKGNTRVIAWMQSVTPRFRPPPSRTGRTASRARPVTALAGSVAGLEDGRVASYAAMSCVVRQGDADVVQPVRAAASGCSRRSRTARTMSPAEIVLCSRSTVTLVPGSVSIAVHSCSTTSWSTSAASSPALPELPRKMSREPGRHDDPEAVVHAAPRPRARATTRCRSPDRPPAPRPPSYCGWFRTKDGILAPGGEQAVLEAGPGDPLQVDGGDDLVGVDVAAAQRDRGAGVLGEGFHDSSVLRRSRGTATRSGRTGARSAGAARVPVTAVAAATSGETRWVRPPLPWRPSKFRFEVDALRSPGASWSGFMPRHIEQPAPRHSAPASLKTTSRPSASACSRTRPEPGPRASGCRRQPSGRPDHAGGGAQVLDPAVGAGAEEDGVHL